jgi:hypothetical protein
MCRIGTRVTRELDSGPHSEKTYRDLAPLLWLRLIEVIPPVLFESKTQVVLLRGKLAVAYPTYDAAVRE